MSGVTHGTNVSDVAHGTKVSGVTHGTNVSDVAHGTNVSDVVDNATDAAADATNSVGVDLDGILN